MFAVLLLCVLPLVANGSSRSPATRVDLIELNHCYDDLGNHKFDQIIGYDWAPDYCRFDVVIWFFHDDAVFSLSNRGGFCHVQRGGKSIASKLFRETWTNYDPEVHQRKLMAEKHRRVIQ